MGLGGLVSLIALGIKPVPMFTTIREEGVTGSVFDNLENAQVYVAQTNFHPP
jgi:hypothetical protein